MKKISLSFFCLALAGLVLINACSKGGGSEPPANPCSGVTVTVNGTSTNPATPGASDGTITVTATGGSGITFSRNGTTFQATGTFTGLAAGTYTITAKTADGCTGTRQFTLTNPTPACNGIAIVVAATPADATPCVTPANGSIVATATGSTGFTYSINGTTFQASGTFNNLATGNYTVTAKDANGCTGTSNVSVGTAVAGPKFTAVRTLLDNNCVSCHNNTIANGGMNWTIDCNLVTNKDRIKARAVDNVPSSMPPTGPLSQTDKNKITDWINAGGRFTD